MTRRRWIADEFSDTRASLLGRNAAHLARSLRVRVGQEFEVSTGDAVRVGRVVHVADERVEFELGASVPQKEPARITLLLAIFKFDRQQLRADVRGLGGRRTLLVPADRFLLSSQVRQ